MCVCASRGVGGAALEQEGVARVAHPDGLGRGGERQLIVGAAVAENLPAVAAVVLRERERGAEMQLEKCWRRWFYGCESAESALTFRREMENSFSHSLQWLASLSFNQT